MEKINIVYNGVLHLKDENIPVPPIDTPVIAVKKKNKTDNLEEYYKEYREKHAQHLKNKDRVRFYKNKYNLSNDFIEKYGDYSADVFKMVFDYRKIKDKNPDIAKSIIAELL